MTDFFGIEVKRTPLHKDPAAYERHVLRQRSILAEVLNERTRQDEKWGEQHHSIPEWLAVLGEEFGEACQAGNRTHFGGRPKEALRDELVQVAAVAVVMLEALDAAK